MEYKLKSEGGQVKYYMESVADRQTVRVGSDTKLDSAEWMLNEGKPYRSDEIEGYPIAVKMNGSVYFFKGEWAEPKRRKRRVKDSVLGM